MASNSTIILIALSLAAVAGLVGLVSYGPIAERVKSKPIVLGIVTLLGSGLGWTAGYFLDIAKGAIADDSIPGNNLHLFVENVSFGFPNIGDSYKARVLTTFQVSEILRSFKSNTETIMFSAEEAGRLNSIASGSGMLDFAYADRAYTVKDLASKLVEDPVYYYVRYKYWADIIENKLRISANLNSDAKKKEFLFKYIDSDLYTTQDFPGIVQGIVGMSSRGNFLIPSLTEAKDCNQSPSGLVTVEKRESTYYANFQKFRSVIASESSGRQATAQRLVELINNVCLKDLDEIFSEGAKIFRFEASKMENYLSEFDRILTSRRADIITITATISNIGKYNAFIRKESKIVVGPKNDKNNMVSILAKLTDEAPPGSDKDKEQQRFVGPYINVASRNTFTAQWGARLLPQQKDKIYGSFLSGSTYLRVGMIANSGEGETDILSPLTPFSELAKDSVADKIKNLDIRL